MRLFYLFENDDTSITRSN